MTIKPDDLNIFYVVHRTVYYKSYKHTFLAIFKTAYWFDCIYLKNLSLSNFVYNLILSGPVYLSIQTDFKTVGTDQRKMAMADTLFFNGRQDKYPYHTNYPPTVPRYPSSQEMFRYDRYFNPPSPHARPLLKGIVLTSSWRYICNINVLYVLYLSMTYLDRGKEKYIICQVPLSAR